MALSEFRDSWEVWREKVNGAIGEQGSVTEISVNNETYHPELGVVTLPDYPDVHNATLTIQKNGTNIQTFTANQSSDAVANINVPTKVSELTNDSGYTDNVGTVTAVKVGNTSYDPTSGVVSLPDYPTVNNATLTIQKNGTDVQTFTANQGSNATANIVVPTNVSELTNDSGYTTNTGTVTSVKVGSTSYDPVDGVVSLPESSTVNNGTLTIQKNGVDVATFTANQSSNATANISVPTNVSDLNNDSGYTTNTGTVTSVKVGSTSYDPVDGVVSLPASSTVNDGILTIQKNGVDVTTFTANQNTNATANIAVPTKVSELTNDSGYTTNTGTVTSVKVGSTSYDPTSGVVSLPAYPTVNNATLTIQKNGTNVQTFTANQNRDATANIAVPTKVSELTNDKGYTTNTGTVTSVKVGSTSYSPTSGVVSLPAYPTVNNATLTIQRNGTKVQTFTANQSSNATANIAVPDLVYKQGSLSNQTLSGPGHGSYKLLTKTSGRSFLASDINVTSNTGYCVLCGWHFSGNDLYVEVGNMGTTSATVNITANGFEF